MGVWVDFTHHEEVSLHVMVNPLFTKNERGARETGDEHDGRFGGVAGRLCPNLGTVRGSYIDGHGGRVGDGERGEPYGWLSLINGGGAGNRLRKALPLELPSP